MEKKSKTKMQKLISILKDCSIYAYSFQFWCYDTLSKTTGNIIDLIHS